MRFLNSALWITHIGKKSLKWEWEAKVDPLRPLPTPQGDPTVPTYALEYDPPQPLSMAIPEMSMDSNIERKTCLMKLAKRKKD